MAGSNISIINRLALINSPTLSALNLSYGQSLFNPTVYASVFWKQTMFTNICSFSMLSYIKDSIDNKQQNVQNLNAIAISNLHYVSILVVWERLTAGSMEKHSLEYTPFLHAKKRFSSWGKYTMQFLGNKNDYLHFSKLSFRLRFVAPKILRVLSTFGIDVVHGIWMDSLTQCFSIGVTWNPKVL